MFERYTESARRLLFFARYETSQFGALAIDTEHMLLGLVRVNNPITARVLAACGVSSEGLRHEIEAVRAGGHLTPTSVEIPFSEGTQRVLRYAGEEADRLKHSYIGVEHLLLALVRADDTTGGAILARHGMLLDDVRRRVVEQLTAAPAAAPPITEPTRADLVMQIDRVRTLLAELAKSAGGALGNSEILERLWMELDSLRARVHD